MSLLEAKQVVKSYSGVDAVRGVSLGVRRGEVFGLLGPNGAGKTTLINIIAAMLAPTAGDVTIDGASVLTEPAQAKRRLGVVSQEIALYDDLSGRENLRFFGELYGLGGSELTSRVEAMIKRLQLEDAAARRIKTYSGGMKRRINIGASLLHDPVLVLMDEPTAGIDPQSRVAIYELVEQLKQGGVAVLYTTHYMEEAQRLCDRVAIIDHGKIIAEGTIAGLLEQVKGAELVRLKLDSAAVVDVETLTAGLAGVELQGRERDEIALRCENSTALLPKLIDRLAGQDVELRGVEIDRPNLETVFLELTGRRLREG